MIEINDSLNTRNDALVNQNANGPISANTLDYDAFLKLLVEQMKNQDPLEPVSETEYIAQLATFSNVEQNIVTNDKLSDMIISNTIENANSLIGRTVTTIEGVTEVVESVEISDGAIFARLDNGDIVRSSHITKIS
ncbi:MAG: flagellar hook capping FlgD N-terminal domain-containing protein [Pseudomonadota bacterium]